MMKVIFGLLFASSIVMAALSEPDRALVLPRNLLLNGGFELGMAQWVASGGTTSSTTTAASVGSGSRAGVWQSSTSSQTLKSSISLPYGLAGKTGIASCNFRNASGSATYKISVTDASSTLATGVSVTSGSTYTRAQTGTFTFSAGATTVNLVITSQTSVEPQINIDDCYLGEISPVPNSVASTSYGWHGHAGLSCNGGAWLKSGIFQDFPAGAAACAMAQDFNNGFGTVVIAPTRLPGIQFTFPAAGYYDIGASFTGSNDSGYPAGCEYFLTDGDTVIDQALTVPATSQGDAIHLHGLYFASSASTVSIRIKVTNLSAGNCYIQQSAQGIWSPLTMSIFKAN